MFAKRHRLNGKEVRFLTRKRQVFSRGIFTIFWAEQYPNRSYHQLSFHIPIAVSKRSVARHLIKRVLIAAQEAHFLGSVGKYYKCFVTLHKLKLQSLIDLLNQKNIPVLKQYLTDQRSSTFSLFLAYHEQQTSQKPHYKTLNHEQFKGNISL